MINKFKIVPVRKIKKELYKEYELNAKDFYEGINDDTLLGDVIQSINNRLDEMKVHVYGEVFKKQNDLFLTSFLYASLFICLWYMVLLGYRDFRGWENGFGIFSSTISGDAHIFISFLFDWLLTAFLLYVIIIGMADTIQKLRIEHFYKQGRLIEYLTKSSKNYYFIVITLLVLPAVYFSTFLTNPIFTNTNRLLDIALILLMVVPFTFTIHSFRVLSLARKTIRYLFKKFNNEFLSLAASKIED